MAKGAIFSGHTHTHTSCSHLTMKSILVIWPQLGRFRIQFLCVCVTGFDQFWTHDGCKCSQMLPQLHCLTESAGNQLHSAPNNWNHRRLTAKLLNYSELKSHININMNLQTVWIGLMQDHCQTHTQWQCVCVCVRVRYQCRPASRLFPAKHPFPWQPRRETGSVGHRKYF